MLKIDDLSAGYGGVPVPHGISLHVGPGECVAVVGPNGAGKTTLFEALSGVVAATGTVMFDGGSLLDVPPARRAHQGIAHVPEGRQVFPSLTVRENLEMGAWTEAGRRQWRDNLERIHTWFPVLAERAKTLAGALSGGQQQMFAIARGLASAPKLLLLDEPSMGLSPAVADEIFERIVAIHAQGGLAVLLVEQRVAEALHFATRGYVLEAGRVVLAGTHESLRSDDRIRRAYLGVSARRRRPRSTEVRADMGNKVSIRRRVTTGIVAVGIALYAGAASAQKKDIEVGLIAPMTWPWARQGQVMKTAADLAIETIDKQGGVKSMGGAKLKLAVFDAGDSAEKAKNAAQRMVAEAPNLVAATGAYLSSFKLAVTEVTERAQLPVLTFSYSDLITSRGFKYVFQTSATGEQLAEGSLPALMDMAEKATGKRPKTIGIVMDNTAASVSFAKPIRTTQLAKLGLTLVVDETFTPPLANATPIVQKVRSQRPDVLILLPTVIGDSKLLLEKMNEFGLGKGRLPTISSGAAILDPDLKTNKNVEQLKGVMSVVADWSTSSQKDITREFIQKTGEPWPMQHFVTTYGDLWIMHAALEAAGKADRAAVAAALRTMDLTTGAAKFFPGGRVKFDASGRRESATLLIVQWQKGVPVTVYPPKEAVANPLWPKH